MSFSIAIPAASRLGIDRRDTDLARTTMRRASLRLLPFLFVLYICNLPRSNERRDRSAAAESRPALQRERLWLWCGHLFPRLRAFEVPSNLVLARVGARYWIARIMITWGLIAAAMMFVRTPIQFYVMRFLLGVAEGGFLLGIVYYLSGWFPAAERARALSRFLIALPLSAAIGNPLSAWLLGFDGVGGLAGWQ